MKKIISNLCVLLIAMATAHMNAQVGIGTASPHPSSILDITGDSGGLLTPRMTTSLREMISSPAEGLVVYDTDESAFYYFDGTNWLPLEGAVMRDNYKLVKDISDLAQELSDGGGAQYQLNSDFLYEINGTIVFDFPIDLNGAYVVGVDVGEDIIENGSGDTLFVGSTGGSLKALTVDGGGNTMFDLDGGNIVVNNSSLRNASSVGTFDNMNVLLFSIVAFSNNNTGLSTNSVSSFTMSNIFWNPSNEGTFLDVDGTYDNFQISTGRVIVDGAAEVGVDVFSDPTITNYASMANLNFNGVGNRVIGYENGSYPGFNFTPIWDVNCEGIPLETDNNSFGDLSLNFYTGTGATTTPAATGIPLKIEGTTTSNNLFRFSSPQTNRLVYEGTKTRSFKVSVALSILGTTNNDVFFFFVAKGDAGDPTATPILATGVAREIGENGDIGAVPLVGTVQLSPGDYIEIWTERDSGSGTIYTASMNVTID